VNSAPVISNVHVGRKKGGVIEALQRLLVSFGRKKGGGRGSQIQNHRILGRDKFVELLHTVLLREEEEGRKKKDYPLFSLRGEGDMPFLFGGGGKGRKSSMIISARGKKKDRPS